MSEYIDISLFLTIPTAISQTKEVLFITDWLGRCYSFIMSDVDLLIVPSSLPVFAVSTMQVVESSMWHVCEPFLPYINSQCLCH